MHLAVVDSTATEITPSEHTPTVPNQAGYQQTVAYDALIAYDALMVGTGAVPLRPAIEGPRAVDE